MEHGWSGLPPESATRTRSEGSYRRACARRSARSSRLSPPASELLAAGAVLGSGFTFEELLGVVSLPEDEALSALDEVLASRLREPPTQGGRRPKRRLRLHPREGARRCLHRGRRRQAAR